MLARFGVPLAAASTVRSVAVDSTETITVTNVVSAPAINKLGSLFNSLNKTVTGALNTLITQQQQQQAQMTGPCQPVDQQQHLQYAQQSAPTVTPGQRFPAGPLPHALPFTATTPQPQLQAPQRHPGAPRLPSDASSAFVRVGPSVGPQVRLDAQHLAHQHAAPPPPPPVRNHVQQPPPVIVPQLTQSQQLTNGEIYREVPRNHVDPRTHLAPAGHGESLQQ